MCNNNKHALNTGPQDEFRSPPGRPLPEISTRPRRSTVCSENSNRQPAIYQFTGVFICICTRTIKHTYSTKISLRYGKTGQTNIRNSPRSATIPWSRLIDIRAARVKRRNWCGNDAANDQPALAQPARSPAPNSVRSVMAKPTERGWPCSWAS